MANYSILINAVINAANLQTQITTLQNQKPITIPVNVNTQQVQQSLQQIQNQVPAGGLQLFNANSGVNAIEEARIAFQGLVKDIGQINNISVLSADQGATVKLNSQAIIDYTNNVGIASQAVLKFNETAKGSGQGAWDQTPIIKYNQDLEQTATDIQQIAIWQDRLAGMQLGNETIIDPQTKTDIADLSAAIETFGTVGGASTKEISAGFSQVTLDIKEEKDTLTQLDAELTAHQAAVDAQTTADATAVQNRIDEDAATQKLYADRNTQIQESASAEQLAEQKTYEQKVKDWDAEAKQRAILSDAEDAAAQKDLENQAKEDQAQDNLHTKSQIIINDLEKQAQLYPEAFNSQEVQAAADALRNVTAAYDANLASENELKLAQNEYNSALAVARNQIQGTTGDSITFGGVIDSVTRKFLIWSVGMAAVMGTLNDIKQGIQYIEDLNKVMTETEIITGQTTEQTNQLAQAYNALATQLGVTTLDLANGALEWQREGYSASDAMKAITASTMQATLGNMDMKTSTEDMIATLHGFSMEADDAASVLDKITALSTHYTTSMEEISGAMGTVATVAKESGATYDQLASYIN